MKSFFKNIKDQGFSLTETLIAIGISGALALTVAKLGQDSAKISKTSERNLDIGNFINEVSFILSEKNNCNATIGTNTTIGTNIPSVIKFVNGTSVPVYSTGNQRYGNNSFSISQITTEASPSGVDLVFLLDRGENHLGSQLIRRKIPLKTIVNGTTIQSCYSDVEGMVETAVKAACKGNTARYDPDTKQCYHMLIEKQCDRGEVLKEIVQEDGSISAECAPIFPTEINCPEGQMIQNISFTGQISCVPINTKISGCPVGSFARRIVDGNFECNALPRCGANQVLRTGANGEPTCQTIGCNTSTQYFAGFDASGTAVCKNFPNRSCPPNNYIKSIDTNGNITCEPVPNHQPLNESTFNFIDGFDSTTNQWSRKNIDQVSERICSYFQGMEWTGSRCILPVINGGWTAWSSWTACTGGATTRSRSRTCTNPAPANGGADCIGLPNEVEECPTYKQYRTITSNTTINLSDVVSGSIRVWAQGGGGGGGRGKGDNGGGGYAGTIVRAQSISGSGSISCTITIGSGGCNGGPSGCSGGNSGSAGGTTTIKCGAQQISAGGGGGGGYGGSSCDTGGCGAGHPKNNESSPRADSIYNTSGHLPSKVIWVNQGGAGGPHKDTGKSPPSNTYGGGGGGGSDQGDHSGGAGRPGIVYIEWLERP